MPTGNEAGLARRHAWTLELDSNPYDARIYLERARCHESLGYFDLAASDAYKSLLLTDEIHDEDGEYHDQALEAVTDPIRTDFLPDLPPDDDVSGAPAPDEEQADVLKKPAEGACIKELGAGVHGSSAEKVADDCSRSAYETLSRTLLGCGDLKSAWDFVERGLKAFPLNPNLQALKSQILEKNGQTRGEIKDSGPKHELPERGLVRREIYPWNLHESDRFSPDNLSLINAELSKVASKCEIRVVELPRLDAAPQPSKPTKTIKQLGIFAKADILPGETVLYEPSILAATHRLHDPLCDACSSPLPAPDSDSDAAAPLPTCPDCDDTAFCSTACLADAQRLYHPAVCGSQQYFDISVKDPSPHAATDALYLLLLARTIAMAETQDVHPLELPEIKFLWGDFSPSAGTTTTDSPPTLPFSFRTSILQPLHLLESLDKDIFAPSTRARYDTWVVNTLMAKYRGVASARLNPRTGVPEACAVHWRWSLANHSCAPNVRWEWPAAPAPAPARAATVAVAVTDDQGSSSSSHGGRSDHQPVAAGEEGPPESTGIGEERRRRRRGCMALFARGADDLVQWGGDDEHHHHHHHHKSRTGGGEEEEKSVMIRAGEEVRNHYCDIDLPVRERREWAAGALGGMCMCERCVWEEGQQQEKEEEKMGPLS